MPKFTYDPQNDLHEAISLSRMIACSFQFACIGDGSTTFSQEEQHDHILSMAILEKHLEAMAQKLRSSR